MEKIIVLIEACCVAYDKPEFVPNKPFPGVTHCNESVRFVAEKMGYEGFAVSMLANEMIDFIKASVAWKKIDLKDAQDQANGGKMVVVFQKDFPHGHVAVVRPGIPDYSTKWESSVPKLMNIGAKNSISVAANWIFTGELLPEAFLLI